MEYYSSIKKNETRPFAAIRINLKIILIDICQTEKVKYHMILLICRILKKMMYINLFEKQKQTCTVTEQIYGYQGGIGSGERNKLQVLY